MAQLEKMVHGQASGFGACWKEPEARVPGLISILIPSPRRCPRSCPCRWCPQASVQVDAASSLKKSSARTLSAARLKVHGTSRWSALFLAGSQRNRFIILEEGPGQAHMVGPHIVDQILGPGPDPIGQDTGGARDGCRIALGQHIVDQTGAADEQVSRLEVGQDFIIIISGRL
jgi:hypothetical protein